MTATLLHISDPHFGDKNGVLNRLQVGNVLSSLLSKAGSDAFLVLSGDISFKGQVQGYAEALEALTPVIESAGISRNRIIACPGNHDIVKLASSTSPFEAFDSWSAALRKDNRCTFSTQSCRLVSFPEADFLVINSAYDGNINYGLVNLPEMEAVLAKLVSTSGPKPPRIAVMHHHLIPFSGRSDESTTRNSYQVLGLLIKHGFSLTLHGHQHALLELGVGDSSMKLYGVGSFRYVTPGFINGASVYKVNDTKQVSADHYAISMDAPGYIRAFTSF